MVDFVSFVKALRRKIRPFTWRVPVNLDLISATIHRGCMGLPQELVDHTIGMLHDDLLALKACSLTCRAMFASTRHLIHQTLCLTQRNNESVLTQEQRRRLLWLKEGYQGVELCFMSYMGELGFLQYAQKIYIHNSGTFAVTPDTLLPHIQNFKSMDRIRAITIEQHDGDVWASHSESCFRHFYPTLTSLTLRRPLGNYALVLRFALQFPNLENLSLEWLDKNLGRDLDAPTTVDRPSPPRWHLRLAHFSDEVEWPASFVRELQVGFKFRSVELEDSFVGRCQRLLDTCADRIRYLTITASTYEDEELGSLYLSQLGDLRRLTIRPILATFVDLAPEFPLLLTITSPVFCELVLVVGKFSPRFNGVRWDLWESIDKFLYERFARRGGFRLIIRAGECYVQGNFQRHAREGFPLLASMGCIHFETYHLTGGYWD